MPYPNYPQATSQTIPNQYTAFTYPTGYYSPAIQPQLPLNWKTAGFAGHLVNSASEITPSEVPMDGGYAIFPLSDMSKIYVKSWNTDGTISTLEFSPVGKSEKPDKTQYDEILDRLSKIEQQLT